jgi:hypothetical protein
MLTNFYRIAHAHPFVARRRSTTEKRQKGGLDINNQNKTLLDRGEKKAFPCEGQQTAFAGNRTVTSSNMRLDAIARPNVDWQSRVGVLQ